MIAYSWNGPNQSRVLKVAIKFYTILHHSQFNDPPNQWMETKTVSAKNTITVSHLLENTTYLFQVRPECEAGVGLESDLSDPLTTKMIIPSKPGKPRAKSVTFDGIELEWTKPEQGAHNATSYTIFYHSTNDPKDKWNACELKVVSKEEIKLTQLPENTIYWFKIRPECESGFGSESDVSEPITTLMIIPGKPGKPKAMNIMHDNIQLEWTKPQQGAHNITAYRVFYRSDDHSSSEWIEQTIEGSNESATVLHLSERNAYSFKVQPEYADGLGSMSDISEPVTTKMIIPSKPGKPRASKISHNSIELEWTKPEQGAHNVTSYTIIYHSTIDPKDAWSEQKVVSKEEMILAKLPDNTTYWFKIRPECESGFGSDSDISKPITTLMIIPGKPGKPKAMNITHDSIQLEWTKPQQGAHNITSYTICYRSTEDPPDHWIEHKHASTEDKWTQSELSEFTHYLFKVRPECDTSIGLESDTSDPIQTKMIIPSKPGKPKILSVTHNHVELEWSKPEQGAHNITSYTVFYRSTTDDPHDEWRAHKDVTSEKAILLVPQLSEKTTYHFKIRPESKAGAGLESDISDPVQTFKVIILIAIQSGKS